MRCPGEQPRGSLVEGSGTLSPPLHINDMGKADATVTPRSKMALFEQFTIPYKDSMASHGTPGPKQVGRRGSDEWCKRHPSQLANKTRHEVHRRMKPSNGSLISSCSAVLNREEAHRDRGQQLAERCPTVVFSSGVSGSSACKPSEKKEEEVIEVHGRDSSSHSVGWVGEDVANSGSPQKCQDGSGNSTPNAKSPRVKERSNQSGSPACQSLSTQSKWLASSNTVPLMDGHLPSSRNSNQKGVTRQVEALPAPIKRSAEEHSQNMAPSTDPKSSTLGPFSDDAIKPKDVICVIGQRLFWSARKTVLRQQQILSDQVFELHKLIQVQKLLAKVPTPLTDEEMYIGTASGKISYVHPSSKAGMNDHEHICNERPKALTHDSGKHGDHMSTPKKELVSLPCKETKAKVPTHATVPLKVVTSMPSGPQGSKNPLHGQSDLPYRLNGVSAWGYPMGPLNGPFICSPSNGGLLGSAFGGGFGVAAGVGQVPPMTPFSFPCYGRNPEMTTTMGSNNQWQAAGVYANPFVGAMTNNWCAMMNTQSQIPMASWSTKSVPSINMHVQASTHGFQPAVPGKQPHLGMSGSSRLVASKSVVLQITSALSHALPERAGPGSVEEQKLAPSACGMAAGCQGAPLGGGGCKVDTRPAVVSPPGQSQGSRYQRLTKNDMDVEEQSCEANTALDLFPLQPTSISVYGAERVCRQGEECPGRVIKAIPRPALAASESAADILLSLQRERKQ